ncbi:MAG: 2,3,4,5-tetrahydropyridine-2,6-carboxylate N-succinyltransferase, partial [Alphaproteobacteria bacterium]
MAIAQQLPINTGASATQMAQTIFGNGATVVGATYVGDNRSSGIFTQGNTVTPGVTPSDTGVILSTGRAKDFTNNSGTTNTNVSPWTSTNTGGVNNDPNFNALAGTNTYDASYLQVDFIPTGNVVTLDFRLASEEYPEWVNSQYNDVVGMWVNGVQANVSVQGNTASIGNINGGNAANLYVDNTADQYNTEMDGFTITLTFTAPVNPGVVNTLKIGVADTSDSLYDTNLLIAAGSVQTAIVAMDDTANAGLNSSKIIDVLANDIGQPTMFVTHINEVAVNPGDTVTLATGQTVTLNADGTLTVNTTGTLETINFTYTMQDGAGLTDTGMVTLTQMACFTAGTLIATPDGERPIETLNPGDLVLTLDDGPQPIRWIGTRTVPARGAFAPVRLAPGALGEEREIVVSPQHRMLVRGAWAELLFGVEEVLVRALDLVNGRTITRIADGRPVAYVHMMFDRHQIVLANGRPSESFLPGPMSRDAFEA